VNADIDEPTSGALALTWILRKAGWARCKIADGRSEVLIGSVSYISRAPEDLLTAVARLTAGTSETRVEFDSEPAAYRWIFQRSESDVRIRILLLRNGHGDDAEGEEFWSSRQTIDTLARATIRCFDQVAEEHSEDDYLDRWRSPFPRMELEALRSVWRQYRDATPR
jgi:hypothetical protein